MINLQIQSNDDLLGNIPLELKLSQSTLQQQRQDLARAEIDLSNQHAAISRRVDFYLSIGWGLVVIGIGLVVIGIVWFFVDPEATLPSLGDYISGTVATCWALAGLLFIYVAFLGQNRQSLMQLLDTRYNRYELLQTRHEIQQQNEMTQRQLFEQTYFQLVRSYNEIVNAIDMSLASESMDTQRRGRDCFEMLYRRFRSNCNGAHTVDRLEVKEIYSSMFNDNRGDLEHYFGLLRQILMYVDFISKKDGVAFVDELTQYVAFLSGQLSSYEKLFIFYHCALRDSEFGSLVNAYQLVKDLPAEILLDSTHSNWLQKPTEIGNEAIS